MKRKVHIHSKWRVKQWKESKRRGRHQGIGKRRGTADTRMPQKVLWMRRQRVLRRLLKKYRESKKIDKHMYHDFYLGAKGNQYKNKTVLIETIHKIKNEKVREEKIAREQAEAKAKRIAAKERKQERREARAAAKQ